ncbi:MAG: RHS repeat-associated core domain-containing protein, partial [Acidobacteriota bacterium]|nr:RHS repeat-associated core domain-containing protein [Acidobacteriota bacterium]
GGGLVEGYVQGYHGLVKTTVSNIYYYQDELGSTSHIADHNGALLESYRYDLYGKPTYWSASNSQLQSSSYQVKDLFTGQRWIPEIGLYDDRNRFMSPDLGRFLQPDPIGFKGDSSNLYRYCGNDWANRSDPTGLEDSHAPFGNSTTLRLSGAFMNEELKGIIQWKMASSGAIAIAQAIHNGQQRLLTVFKGLQVKTSLAISRAKAIAPPPSKGNFAVTYQQVVGAIPIGDGFIPVVAIARVGVTSNGQQIKSTYRLGLGLGGAVGILPDPLSTISLTSNVSTGRSSGFGITTTLAVNNPIRGTVVGSATESSGGESVSSGIGYGSGAGASVSLTYDGTIGH